MSWSYQNLLEKQNIAEHRAGGGNLLDVHYSFLCHMVCCPLEAQVDSTCMMTERESIYVFYEGLFVLLLFTLLNTIWNNLSVYLAWIILLLWVGEKEKKKKRKRKTLHFPSSRISKLESAAALIWSFFCSSPQHLSIAFAQVFMINLWHKVPTSVSPSLALSLSLHICMNNRNNQQWSKL